MKFSQLMVCSILGVFYIGCAKISATQSTAALNIVNAINNSNPIVTDFQLVNAKGGRQASLQFYATANQIPFGSFWESGSYVGETPLSISQISDTNVVIWSGEVNLPAGSIHSLFFCGDTSTVDTLFTTDIIPYYPPSDSAAGVRFVNLVPKGGAISVNIQGNVPTQTEFANLGYKGMSNFKFYSANSANAGGYTFEIRDQTRDSLLTVFYWFPTLGKSNTIYIVGTSASGVNGFEMNNY